MKVNLESVGLDILQKLKDLHAQVVSRVAASFDNYARNENTQGIEELFKVFSTIQERDMGLTKYGKYVVSKISAKADAQLSVVTAMQSFDKPNIHVDLMTELLELVAQAVQVNESVIQENYGKLHV